MMIVVLDQDALRVDVVLWEELGGGRKKRMAVGRSSTLSEPELSHL
jgi:hypothetical protein